MSLSPQSPQLITPVRGAAIFSSDNEQFAYVKDVRLGCFELDLPMARDFWLSCQYIATADEKDVRLNISRDDVDEHRLSAPAIEPDGATG